MARIISKTEALNQLKRGIPVGIPTETVYGLAAPINNEEALKKIFAFKKRPFFDPLIVHVADLDQAKSLVQKWPRSAEILARKFWPGPLTFVLPKRNVSDLITSGLQTVGIRLPNHPISRDLIRDLGIPLAAPSANRFGHTSPTTAAHVTGEFPEIDMGVVDGGPCEGGIESTIVSLEDTAPQSVNISLLRAGLILPEQLEQELKNSGYSVKWTQLANDKPTAPGQIKHHYMPDIPLVIVRNSYTSKSELVEKIQQRFGDLPSHIDGIALKKPSLPITKIASFDLPSEPTQAARELYARLRAVSQNPQAQILLWQQPRNLEEPLWASILERLNKAASLIIE